MSAVTTMFPKGDGIISHTLTVLVLSKLKKINATATQPQRNVLKYFALFKKVAHSLEPGETPSNSQKMMK